MNTTKSVYNKLFSEDKIELASERVELAGINDLKKIIAETRKNFDGFNKLNTQTQSLAKSTIEAANMFQTSRNKMYVLMQQLEKQAKELGLEITSTPDFKEAIELYTVDRDVEQAKGYLRQVIK